MMYIIYRNGKPYGKPSASRTYLEYQIAMLKVVHIDDVFEIKEVEKCV